MTEPVPERRHLNTYSYLTYPTFPQKGLGARLLIAHEHLNTSHIYTSSLFTKQRGFPAANINTSTPHLNTSNPSHMNTLTPRTLRELDVVNFSFAPSELEEFVGG